MSRTDEALEAALIAAHAAQDRIALVTLYTQAAEAAADTDRACFFLTHAYIFALEAGDARVAELHGRLKAEGREE